MIRFWVRELLGWCLIAIGLLIFYACIAMLLDPGAEVIFEAPPIILIGIIVFRGGIHLLKVSLAARICLQTRPEEQSQPPARPKRTQKIDAPLDW